MDEIRKYSREWFVTSAQNGIKDAARNLKPGVENDIQGNLDKNLFNGSKETVKTWLSLISKGPEMTKIIEQYGGLDNLFALIDVDADGELSLQEAKDIAATDTPDDETKLNSRFTTKDLQTIYENVMSVDNAEVEETGNKKLYKYQDGSKTEVEYDNDGNILKTISEKQNEEGKTIRRIFDGNGKLLEVDTGDGKKSGINEENGLKIKNTTDEKGRVINTIIEGKTEKDNKQIDIKYANDGSKTVKTDTIGRTIIEKFDKDGNLIKKEETFKYEGDLGKLDGVIENTYQGSAGDCWLLAGVNSLAQSPKGQQMIKDAIHKNEDGSITITLKGVNRSYTYSPEEVVSYDYASSPSATATGDYDMNLIERAVSEYRREVLSKPENEHPRYMRKATNRSPLDGGLGEESMFYLTGKKAYTTSEPNKMVQSVNDFAKNPNRYGFVVSFKADDPSVYSEEAAQWVDRKDVVDIVDEHAYTVTKIDNEYVYVKDPRDSFWEIKYPKDKFMKNIVQCSMVDLDS